MAILVTQTRTSEHAKYSFSALHNRDNLGVDTGHHRGEHILESHHFGSYTLEIIDIYQQPALASTAQIIAIPTLGCAGPLPPCKTVGSCAKSQSSRGGSKKGLKIGSKEE